ncbi:hypothetical protein PG2071B_1126 [Bifidobacterium pseudolongum subsp. globosum]|uniref:Uncharacterized protein n=2 Tax=Bifidobacterium pseudolongum TaxID=1694 RepID=A0A4Q5A6C2_9BIFI|nr:hypothetical protein PG2071B_1126 [Bifidobacterium pseudolongum subsp. globosum]
MYMKTIESSIAVIRNSGRILLYWDTGWDCWLLPNQTIHEPDTPRACAGHIGHAAHILPTLCTQNSQKHPKST